MPNRCTDLIAWRRTVLSDAGPPSGIRLVLLGMALFMDADGDGCFLGVRRLARITGFDKTTSSS